jgi:hypothetical protein
MEHLSLGGPGPGCSVTRLRRLEAGELSEAEAGALRDHLLGCSRCQRSQQELTHERVALERELPFSRFAAGVAERLATAPSPRRRAMWVYAAPLALAATLAAVVLPLTIRRSEDTPGNRTKGSPGAALVALDQLGTHELMSGNAISPGAHLTLSLRPAGHPYAAAALVEPGQTTADVSPLFVGPAKSGPAGPAFEWTGSGHATLVVWFSDTPISENHFLAALRADRPDPDVTVVNLFLVR